MKYIFTLLIFIYSPFLIAQNYINVNAINIESNQTVEGIAITISNKKVGYSKTKISNSIGKANFQLPVAGTYHIFIEESNIYTVLDTVELLIRNGANASVNLLLISKSNQLPTVNIENEQFSVAKLNNVNAEVASELTLEEINSLPIEGRDITRALYRLPNISQATGFFPEAPTIAINGANPLFTNYMIDGLENNENFLGGMRFNIPVGFAENVNVLSNNFSAEYGLTANGIINITSKKGSNKSTGEVFYLTRPGAIIDASSPYAQRDLSGNQVKDGFMRQQAGFGLGGAIVKNKTFYYINMEQTLDVKDNLLSVPELGVNESIRGQNNFTYLSARIDQFWNSKWHSSLRVNQAIVSIDRQGGGLDGGVVFPSAASTQTRNSFVIASKNQYISKNFSAETNYQFGQFNWNYDKAKQKNSPNVLVFGVDGQSIAALGHPGYQFEEAENTHLIQQKFKWQVNKHQLKLGAEVRSSSFSLFGGGNPNGSYQVQLNQSQQNDLLASNIGSELGIYDLPTDVQVKNYAVELRPNSFGSTQNILSAYISDAITLSKKLNTEIGIRYDYDNLSKGGGNNGDINNIAPRLSFNYQLNNKMTIRAGYGIYYEKIQYAIYSDALQQSSNHLAFKKQLQKLIDLGELPSDTDIDKITNEGNRTASIDGKNVSYLNGPSSAELQAARDTVFSNEMRVLNPNGYDNPYSHQLMLGYQYQVKKDVLFYVDVVHNQSYKLFRLRNLNAAEAYVIDPDNVVVRTQQEADLTRLIPISNQSAVIDGERLTGVARNIMMTESAGRSRYTAASFTLNKLKGKNHFSYRISYTLSKLENNTEDINFRAMDANNFEAEWGPSINDRTHIINGLFSYFPIKNLSVSLTVLLQSGQPINRIPDATIYGTSDLNGDGSGFGDAYNGNSDRSPGESRNSDRLPWSNTFDVGIQYKIMSMKNSHFELRADVFNVFNAQNLSGYANNALQSNQIQVGPASSGFIQRKNAAPPRQFQFGLRYIF